MEVKKKGSLRLLICLYTVCSNLQVVVLVGGVCLNCVCFLREYFQQATGDKSVSCPHTQKKRKKKSHLQCSQKLLCTINILMRWVFIFQLTREFR